MTTLFFSAREIPIERELNIHTLACVLMILFRTVGSFVEGGIGIPRRRTTTTRERILRVSRMHRKGSIIYTHLRSSLLNTELGTAKGKDLYREAREVRD